MILNPDRVAEIEHLRIDRDEYKADWEEKDTKLNNVLDELEERWLLKDQTLNTVGFDQAAWRAPQTTARVWRAIALNTVGFDQAAWRAPQTTARVWRAIATKSLLAFASERS